MAEYRINGDGELVVEDEDGDITVAPPRDFPQILALIAPAEASTPAVRPAFAIAGGWLKGNGLMLYSMGNDRGGLADWFINQQDAATSADIAEWASMDNLEARNAMEVFRAEYEQRRASDRVTFTIGVGRDRDELRWHYGDKSGLVFYAQGAEDVSGDTLPEYPDDYDALAAYIVKHQPAVTIDQVTAWGERSEAAVNALAFLKSQQSSPAAAPAAKEGPWYMRGEYLHYRERDTYVVDAVRGQHAADIAAWAVASQPEVSADDLRFLTDGDNSTADCVEHLRAIRARMEAPAGPTATLWTLDADGDLRYKGCYAAGKKYDEDDIIPRVIAAQPVIDAETERVVIEDPSFDVIEALRPFVTDAPAEAKADCDCVSAPADVHPAPEVPAQRNVVITITFDPADAECAESIYRGVNSIGYPYRRDCVRIRVDER